MAYPVDDLTNVHLNASTDDPSQARAELNALVLKVQAMIAATGTGANNALKLDSNGDVPTGVGLADQLAIAGGGTGAATAAAALINFGISALASELNYNNISTLGIAEASKVLTTNSSNNSSFGGISVLPSATGGTATAYTATTGITALEVNRVYKLRMSLANTGGATLNIDSTGVKTILGLDNLALSAGNLELGQVSNFFWNGTNFILLNAKLSAVSALRGAMVYQSTSTTIPGNSSVTTVNWQTAIYNTDTIWESVTNPNRLTVPTGVTGIRLYFKILVNGSSVSTDSLFARIRKNGAEAFAGNPAYGNIALGISPQDAVSTGTSLEITVTGGDYFDIYVAQNSGGNKFTSTGSHKCLFGMEIIR